MPIKSVILENIARLCCGVYQLKLNLVGPAECISGRVVRILVFGIVCRASRTRLGWPTRMRPYMHWDGARWRLSRCSAHNCATRKRSCAPRTRRLRSARDSRELTLESETIRLWGLQFTWSLVAVAASHRPARPRAFRAAAFAIQSDPRPNPTVPAALSALRRWR